MGTNSIGKLTAQMIVETEQGEASLKKVDGLSKLAQSSLSDVADAFVDVGASASSGAAGVEKHTKAMSSGEQELRNFYREQRLQDRTVRESKDALLGLTFGIMAVTSGMGEGSAKAKQFQTALIGGIAAMQAGEFAAFGLGTAGKNLGGTLGGLAGSLAKNAGWIGAIVGLGTGLYMFFRKSNEEAKKAAEEGLKKYNEMLEKISGKMEDFSPDTGAARKAAVSRELEIVEARIAIVNRLRASQDKGEAFYASDEEFKKAALVRGEAIDVSKKALDDLYLRSKELSTELNSIPNVITAKSPAITKDDAKKAAEERLKAQEEMNKSIVPFNEAVKEQADFAVKAYEAHQMTKDELLEELKALQKRSGAGEEYNEIQIQIDRAEKDHADKIKQSADEEKRSLDDKAEQLQLQYQLGKISAEKAIEELEILRDSSIDVNQRLKYEQKIVDVKKEQIQKGNEQLDQAARIGDILQRAFSESGDDFIAKLNQALQIAVQIAKLMQTKANGESASALDWIESAASVLGFFANTGTESTGATSSQSPQLSLSMSSSSSNIMPNGQTYYPIRTTQPVPKGFLESRLSGGDNSALLAEIRALRTELANKDFSFHLHNVVTAGKMLEKFMPEYERYKKNKVVSDQ